MQIDRKNSDIHIGLDSALEALALFAVLTNNPSLVTPEWFAKGQFIYKCFFHNVETLATQWEAENKHLYMDVKKRRGLG